MRLVRVIVCIGLAIFVSNCGKKHEVEWADLMDGLPNRLVVVFKDGADSREVSAFLQTHTYSPTSNLEGDFDHRPEVGAVMKVGVQGHVAYEIGFWSNVTAAQITTIREEMAASSLVYGIYENVDPAEIVLE